MLKSKNIDSVLVFCFVKPTKQKKTSLVSSYSDKRESNNHEGVLNWCNVRFRNEVRRSGGGEEEYGGGGAKKEMFSEEIC